VMAMAKTPSLKASTRLLSANRPRYAPDPGDSPGDACGPRARRSSTAHPFAGPGLLQHSAQMSWNWLPWNRLDPRAAAVRGNARATGRRERAHPRGAERLARCPCRAGARSRICAVCAFASNSSRAQSGIYVMRANATGIQGVLDVAWGTALLVPAGSLGTLSRLAASAKVPGAARNARCREAPARFTGRQCGVSGAYVPLALTTATWWMVSRRRANARIFPP
jgi:hypothetical protein